MEYVQLFFTGNKHKTFKIIDSLLRASNQMERPYLRDATWEISTMPLQFWSAKLSHFRNIIMSLYLKRRYYWDARQNRRF